LLGDPVSLKHRQFHGVQVLLRYEPAQSSRGEPSGRSLTPASYHQELAGHGNSDHLGASFPKSETTTPELISRLQSALADQYRIEREIGAGGMATVYLAHDLRHDRRVALKLMRPVDDGRSTPHRHQTRRNKVLA